MNTTATKVPQQSIPAKAWLFVFLLSIVGCLNYLDRTMITTMRSSIMAEMPMTDAQFGLLSSVFLWVYGLLSPFAGYLADKFNRSKVIVVSLIVWSLVTWLTAHAKTFDQLLLTRALMGISEACYIPAALALIVDYHRGSTRSLATGIHMAGVMAGQTLGFIGGWLAEAYNWSFAFSLMGLTGILYAAALAFVLRDRPKGEEEVPAVDVKENSIGFIPAIKTMFVNISFIKVLVYWSMMGVASWLVMGWLPTYYKEHFNLTQSQAGIYATGYLYPASLAGVILGGFLADRWSRTNTRARILLPVIGLLVAAPFIYMATSTTVLMLSILFFIVYALTRSFCDANMMPILCMVADERYRATGYGILNMFSCFVGGIALYAGGYLRDMHVNLSSVYHFAALTMVLCAILLYTVKPKMN